MNADLTYDGRIPEELMMNLEREIALANEAYCVEHLIPMKRQFTHAELAPAIAAIRELEAAKLKVPTATEIDAAMMEALKP